MSESAHPGGTSQDAHTHQTNHARHVDCDDYDVAIVGASIAGCAAATFLARSGAKVALLESHSDPKTFKRVCTHLIQSSASPTIERLGLRGAIEDAGAQPSDINIWTRYGWICFDHADLPAPMRDHPAWNIRRETFDPMLRELAAATDGVQLMLGHTVHALLREGTRVRGVAARERDGSEHELRAKLVLAADGRDSSIAKLAGQPTKLRPNRRFGYAAYYRDTPLRTGSSAQMWLLDPSAAYAFPTDGGLTLLACMPHKDRLPEFKADPEAAMQRLFEGLPEGPPLDPAKREGQLVGKLEMPNVVRQTTSPGLAFIGDAALAADPLWGVGCGWALQSAEWLAESVAPALSADGDPAAVDRALAAYAARHSKGLDAHEKFCSAYSSGKRFNPGEKLLFRAAARDAELTVRMAQMGGRWITPQEMMTPRTIGRMLRVNISRSKRPRGLRERPAGAPVAAVAQAAKVAPAARVAQDAAAAAAGGAQSRATATVS
ncbi:MAG TPA: NAD(P)/FAD-dependent oxidoreductase [Solirubrobacteraceae bacterium]|nr:NAD(P)/FAD-dependent oxidoreductase [Solirubrobacteraceae bacterium]